MKINKHTLIWAAKKSASVSEMAKKLGKDEDYEERLWEKMLRLAPGAEDFIEKNEAKINMQIAKANGSDDFKEHRLAYISATLRLIDNKLITDASIPISTKRKKRFRIERPVRMEEESGEDKDALPIASEVSQDLLESILK